MKYLKPEIEIIVAGSACIICASDNTNESYDGGTDFGGKNNWS